MVQGLPLEKTPPLIAFRMYPGRESVSNKKLKRLFPTGLLSSVLRGTQGIPTLQTRGHQLDKEAEGVQYLNKVDRVSFIDYGTEEHTGFVVRTLCRRL
jgi:hypothetical protein